MLYKLRVAASRSAAFQSAAFSTSKALNKRYEIACLPGDGIGIEVMDATKIVLDKLKFDANLEHGDIGWKIWCNEGDPFPQRTIDLCKRTDCALFAAITSKPKDEAARELKPELHGKGFVYSSPIVGMRQLFDLHTNMRPCKAYQGNPLNVKEDIDLVIFRENTEGLYAGVEYYPLEDELRSTMTKFNKKMAKFDSVSPEDIAITARIITRRGCERIIRSAFEFAKKDGRKTVTVVEKPNVLRETSGLFLRIAREIAKEYPDIETRETNIDAQCMFLVRQPEDFGVMVTSNLFGDILSDLSAQLIGGLGFAPSANFGDNYAVFEPTHGSAPPLAGKGIANPTAMILTAQMMLDHLGEKEMALKLERAVADVLAEGKVQCQDMGGTASTMDMAKAIAAKL